MTLTERVETLSARLAAALDELARDGVQSKLPDFGVIAQETAALCRDLPGLPAGRQEPLVAELEALNGQLRGLESLLEQRLDDLQRDGLACSGARASDVEG